VPIYPLKCSKGHTWEQVLPMHHEESEYVCPTCCGAGAQDFAAKFRGRHIDLNRKFTGTESLSVAHGFHPDEVSGARVAVEKAGGSGSCIRDDGTVRFTERREERAFTKAMNQIQGVG
jgi:hypothetical protein